ncbi:MAG: U32 family peptidase [Candidatus Omnitrophica bacterium]|nr:U32 family peptidase [Candidatus Omnitrophota bacterium]
MVAKKKFCISLNGCPKNLEILLEKFRDHIHEVFYPAPPDILATSRENRLPITHEELKRQVCYAHEQGVRYNVLMDGACHGGVQFSTVFQSKVLKFIDFLNDIKADSVTISDPFLIKLVRNNLEAKIVVSGWSDVASPLNAKRFQECGADSITLGSHIIKNFQLLPKIKKVITKELRITLNGGFLHHSVHFFADTTIVSHLSVVSDYERMQYGDYSYPLERYRLTLMNNPLEFLMCAFVRPEDTHLYDKDILFFEIIGENAPTEWMVHTLQAYINRSYEGNILDLFSHFAGVRDKRNIPNQALSEWMKFSSNVSGMRLVEKCEEYYQAHQLGRFFEGRKVEVTTLT